jgi:hypothetical protein
VRYAAARAALDVVLSHESAQPDTALRERIAAAVEREQRPSSGMRRIEQREDTPGNPADGPYPASVGEVADELAGLVVELDAGPARGLVRELVARLPEREAPSRDLPEPTGWTDAVGADGEDAITPHWERPRMGVITAWVGGVEVDGAYCDDLAEVRDDALALLAAVRYAGWFAAEREGGQ